MKRLLRGASLLALCAVVMHRGAHAQSEVTLRIIVCSTAEQAAQVRERLEQGGNFVAIAAEQSIDPTAAAGGLLGHIDVASLRPELRAAVHGLGVGQLSGIVRIPTGFAVLKVVPDDPGDSPAAPHPGVAAAGKVKFVLDVGGLVDAEVLFGEHRKPDAWAQDLKGICQARRTSLTEGRQLLERELAQKPAEGAHASLLDIIETRYALGQLYAYTGDMDRTIAEYQRALEVASAAGSQARVEMLEALGVAHLHKADLDNGVFRRPGARDLLSASGLERLARTDDVERAIDFFGKYLAERPDSLEVRWLLNLAYMSAGGYPARVPSAYLIPPSALESGDDVGRFADVAEEAGLNHFGSAGGVIVDDLDNDGRFDVVVSSFNGCEPLRLYHRDADGRFRETTAAAGLGDQLGGLNILQADYDNDGCLDILVLRGGWELPQRKSLLHNNCNGTFTDVTRQSGLDVPATATQAAVWVDVDNDGLLDLFVGTEEGPAQLFHNEGRGKFVDIARAAGVDRTAFTKGVAAADYDNDGWPDLYVSNNGGDNFLYHNNHNGTFTEMAGAAGVRGPKVGFATWFFDYDNDGWPDLFVTSYYTSVEETVRSYLKLPLNANTLKLYRNLGDGSFEDVTKKVGLEKSFMPMGRQLRRHRQRRLPRHLSRNRESVVRGSRAERAAAQPRWAIVRGRHEQFRYGRAAQGPRRGVCRPR